eukprot:scaffold7850_cov372-Pinguiococcus_pyrenoidosus.AAC.1
MRRCAPRGACAARRMDVYHSRRKPKSSVDGRSEAYTTAPQRAFEAHSSSMASQDQVAALKSSEGPRELRRRAHICGRTR